tara:strand:+ start:260 stop:397 length:138 start_codon:yes stop_codon:yes gene_type:complete
MRQKYEFKHCCKAQETFEKISIRCQGKCDLTLAVKNPNKTLRNKK